MAYAENKSYEVASRFLGGHSRELLWDCVVQYVSYGRYESRTAARAKVGDEYWALRESILNVIGEDVRLLEPRAWPNLIGFESDWLSTLHAFFVGPLFVALCQHLPVVALPARSILGPETFGSPTTTEIGIIRSSSPCATRVRRLTASEQSGVGWSVGRRSPRGRRARARARAKEGHTKAGHRQISLCS